ncbi:MAG: C10 family peptidase [Paludibacteraceae bacterium]|nr:C10 family peptidase [Paludibacteraceae bacterium]
MRKTVCLLAIALFGFLGGSMSEVSAATRSQEDALRIAGEFRKKANIRRAPGATSVVGVKSQLAFSSSAYFAVNTGDSYVLVSADDRMPEVLGYSDKGAFDPENMSPALQYWLACYEEAASAMESDSYAAAAPRATAAVAPLMKSQWSQSDPYYRQTPTYDAKGYYHCVTGCVATAMAQVMYYHKYPEKGKGSHSYSWVCDDPVGKSATLSVNFGNTTYDWANMTDTYKFQSYTTKQANAVATLMYSCGVAVDMNYGENGSGAQTQKVPAALNKYFGYDANYQRIRKDMYSPDSLNSIIAAELVAKRPVLVSGSNDKGGHAFVCDGADGQGYFHINWGWAGSNDGYYLLSLLTPTGKQGTGGTDKGYNKNTAFYIGLQPAKSNSPKAIPQIATTTISFSNESSFSRSSTFSASIAKFQNYGLTDFDGSYGVALMDKNGKQVVAVLKQANRSLAANYYVSSALSLSSISIPSSIAAGVYRLCVVYKDANYNWMPMLCTAGEYYRTIELTSSKVIFHPNDWKGNVAGLPGTLNKDNAIEWSSDMTWYNSSFFDFGPTDAPNLDRWAEWSVQISKAGEYSIDVTGYYTNGHQWQLELINGDAEIYKTASSHKTGEITENSGAKWILPAGNYKVRVKNIKQWGQPKLKSIKFTYEGPAGIVLPATLNKDNKSAVSSDMTWYNGNFFDFGPTDAPNLDRWAEWEINISRAGNYSVSAVGYYTNGHQWQLELVGTNYTYTLPSSHKTGEVTDNGASAWNLPSGKYTIRVKNIKQWGQPKLKSITLNNSEQEFGYEAIENAIVPLDKNATMYDILGRQVDASYKGIVIQNGRKYLLR